jgi:hypothetical protein
VGDLIRYFTGTRDEYSKWHDATVNHAGIYVGYVDSHFGDFGGIPQIMQADPFKGFSFADWDTYPGAIWLDRIGQRQKDGTLIELLPDLDARISICEVAESIWRKRYNFIDIAAIAVAQERVHQWDSDYGPELEHYLEHPPWWIKRLSDNNRFICSQAVDFSWKDAKTPTGEFKGLFADNRPYGMVSPADLLSLQIA